MKMKINNPLRNCLAFFGIFLISILFFNCKNACENNRLDDGELGIDCGGNCPDTCTLLEIIHCNNDVKDEDEKGLDCGGVNCEPCRAVIPNKEIFITATQVVNSAAANTGSLSFGHLIKNMTTNTLDSKALVLSLFNSWKQDQTVNGLIVSARPNIDLIIDTWKNLDNQSGVTDAAWNINLDNAPFRLLGIANRMDLHQVENGLVKNAGEGRFIFCAIREDGTPMEFTVIFEYGLVATSLGQVNNWAKKWHALSKHTSFDAAYLTELISVTEEFVGKNKAPTKPNGSALNQLRTNEVDIAFPWELREFNLTPTGFAEVTRKMTPDDSFNNSEILKRFAQTNLTAILDGSYTIPNTFEGNPFMAGNCSTDPATFEWTIPNPDASLAIAANIISFNSCNGCHGGATNTRFTHVKPRVALAEAEKSDFLNFDISLRRDTMERKFLQLDSVTITNSTIAKTIPPTSTISVFILTDTARVPAGELFFRDNPIFNRRARVH